MTARKAISARKEQAPKGSVTATAEKPKAHFPTARELIAIAAAIADPQEDEKETARRALNLWRACNEVLTEEVAYSNLRERNRIKRQAFLSACGLTMDDTKPRSRGPEKTVPLNTFFMAINPDTRTLSAKWPLFWKRETEKVIPDLRGGALPDCNYPYRLPTDPQGEISAISIIPCGDRFTIFLQETVKETKANIGATGPKWRKRYEAARKLLSATGGLPKEEASLLADLPPQDMQRVRDKCCKYPRDVRKLMAAIDSAMAQESVISCRTERSNKKA